MATSDVEIVNNALYLIGAKPIASFTEGTDRANLYNSVYPITRDATLRVHPWRFARSLFDTVAEAVADCAHIYATTVRKRGLVIPVVTPPCAAARDSVPASMSSGL